jgi:diguanylate cyclase (GGDEF)-like protein
MSAPDPAAATPTAAGAVADAALLDLQRFTLMLVDDDLLMLDTVQAYLESYGYGRFVTTSDPRAAMGLLAKHRPDTVLLDLSMPELNGFDILAQVRAHPELRYTPVIILTGESDTEARLRALELGATDFLTKPVDPSELVLRVRNVLAFKAYQDRLAATDLLTGLPNQRTFHTALAAALAGVSQAAGCALLHVDLDRFKQVNERLGRRGGDRVLCAAARAIERALAAAPRAAGADAARKPLCARIGGNSFGVLLPALDNLTQIDEATALARRLLDAFADPLQVEGGALSITASVGVALSPADGDDAESLLRHAEMAMYLAKRRGRDTYAFFAREANPRGTAGITLDAELRQALDRNELVLYFQPEVEIASGRIAAAEVLVGWRHPEKGLIAPEQFASMPNGAGLTGEVARWALRAACNQFGVWGQQGLPPVTLALDVPADLVERELVWDTVRGALDRSGVLPQYLTLEFDEAVLTDDASSSLSLLRELSKIGVRLAVDRAGGGYLSPAFLSRSPLTELKLDAALVAGLPADRHSCAAVGALIAMADKLALKVVAIGVETPAQLEFLHGQGCHGYQGALCSRPLTAEPFAQLLLRGAQPASPK